MSDYHFTHRIDARQEVRASDPTRTLVEFFEANGYSLDAASEPSSNSKTLTRGEAGAGWWSSNMTELRASVEIRSEADAILLDYRIDVTGQHLTEADRTFWKREAEAAEAHLDHPDRSPRDLRPAETERAQKIHGTMLTYGIWGAILMFLVITFLHFLGMV